MLRYGGDEECSPFEVIHHPDEVLNSMNEWCIKHHGDSGLTKAVRDSKVELFQCDIVRFFSIFFYFSFPCNSARNSCWPLSPNILPAARALWQGTLWDRTPSSSRDICRS